MRAQTPECDSGYETRIGGGHADSDLSARRWVVLFEVEPGGEGAFERDADATRERRREERNALLHTAAKTMDVCDDDSQRKARRKMGMREQG